MKIIEAKIQGVVPLLQHRYIFADERENAAKLRSGKKDHREEWKDALFLDPACGVYEPSLHIEAALVKAAVNFQIVGKGKKTYKDLFKSAVFVSPEKIPFGITGTPDELVKSGQIEVHKALVRVMGSGVERYRPMLKNWSLEFTIEIADGQLDPDVVKQVLEYAGRAIGIGDNRPRYGRFSVVKFK